MENFTTDGTEMWHAYDFPPGACNTIARVPLLRSRPPLAVVVQDVEGLAERGTKPSAADRLRYHFTLHAGSPEHELLCRVEPEKGAYEVYSEGGDLLARISHSPGRVFPWPQRVKWRLELHPPESPYVQYSAYKGTPRAWTMFVILSPLWAPLFLFGALASLGRPDPWSPWGFPVRTKWRSGIFRLGLDYRGVNEYYRLKPGSMDIRVAYAQAIIHTWSSR